MDMVNSIMSTCYLAESLLGEVLKITVSILNRVSRKPVSKTLLDLWIDRKLSLNHLLVGVVEQRLKYIIPR